MFLAEKGVDIPKETVDIMAGANRQAPYTDKNPYGQMPALELDDGSIISETTVICEYLEEQHPTPALIGATAEERAETRMWTRRIVLGIIEPMSAGFRFAEGLPMFKERMHCMPDAADDFKALAQEGLKKLDGLIEGQPFIAGDRFTLADITLFSLIDFFQNVGQPLDPELKNIAAWFERVGQRPSAAASA
jgi:glutathione S-transferase